MPDLTNLAAVKDYLQLETRETGRDVILSRLISSESGRFISLSGNPILLASYTDTVDGNGTQRYLPRKAWPRYPLVSVSSLTIDSVAVPARVNQGDLGYSIVESRIELVGYRFSGTYSIPQFDGSTRGIANVVLAYTAGYATAPAEVSQAVIEMVALKFLGTQRTGLNSQSIQGESVSYNPAPWAAIQDVISSYVRPVI